MSEKNNFRLIVAEFVGLVNAFVSGDKLSPSCKIIPQYINDNSKNDINELKANIYYNRFILEFVYSFENMINQPKSILECRVCFSKNDNLIEYPLYNLMHLINDKDFSCYFFPFIESPERMKLCFGVISNAVKRYLPSIEKIAASKEKTAFLKAEIKEEIKTFFGQSSFSFLDSENSEKTMRLYMENYFSVLHISFSSDRYNAFLKGNYNKAIKKYSRTKKLTEYEKRLLCFMKNLPQGEQYTAADPCLNTLDGGLKIISGSEGLKAVLFSLMIFLPIFFIVYAGLYLIMLNLFYDNALYVTGSEFSKVIKMFLPALMTSIIIGYFRRNYITKLVDYDKIRHLILYDTILNRKHEENIMRKFGYFIITACLLFTIFSSASNIAFYSNGLRNNLDFFSLKGEYISYNKVDSVWSVSGVENRLGRWVDDPFYVMLLKDGRKIEFSSVVSYDLFEKNITPLLSDRDINSYKVNTVDEIVLSQ